MKQVPVLTAAAFFEATYTAGSAVQVGPRPFSSLTLRTTGKIFVSAGESALFSGPGTLTFIPEGCAYTTQILESGRMRILHFDTVPSSPAFSAVPLVSSPAFPIRFQNLFDNAISHFSSYGCDLFAMSTAYEVLNEAEQTFFGTEPQPPLRMVKCKDYLDENITDPTLRISFLAQMCRISEVHFRNEFKKYYGLSPLSYIKKRRIEIACRLLSTGLYQITQVALLSGFESISYFTAEFRRMKGCTPKEYRTQ